MSQYITGAGSAAWAGLEQNYGQGYTSTPSLLNLTSESLSATYNKLEEGTLLASKTRPAQDLGSVDVSGGVSTILNPGFIDWVLEATLGVQTADTNAPAGFDGYIYTLAAPNASLPSSEVRLLRGTQGFKYDGMVISSLALDCTAQDFVKADINFNGRKETNDNTITPPVSDGFASYKCTKAKLFNAAAGADDLTDFSSFSWDTCPAGSVYDVQRVQLTIDNGLEDVPATYCSGLYGNEPIHSQRSVTIQCEVPYSAAFETFRQTYYANENASNLALLLAFCTKDVVSSTTTPAEQVYVILPNVSLDGASANVSGQGLVNANYSGTALSVGQTEPIKVIVYHEE